MLIQISARSLCVFTYESSSGHWKIAERRWHRKGRERTTKEAGGGLRINHNRLQSEAPFFFLHFSSLVPLNQSHTSSSSSSMMMMMMLHFSLSLRLARSRWLAGCSPRCLIASQRLVSYKQKRLINSSSKLLTEQLQSFLCILLASHRS